MIRHRSGMSGLRLRAHAIARPDGSEARGTIARTKRTRDGQHRRVAVIDARKHVPVLRGDLDVLLLRGRHPHVMCSPDG
jgi:hypothetical protein